MNPRDPHVPGGEPGTVSSAGARRFLAVAAGLLLLTALAFARAPGCGFVFDDFDYLVGNPRLLDGPTAENLRWALLTVHAGNWHPLTWLSFLADLRLWGLSAGALHAMNVVYHLATVAALFAVLARMTGAFWRSALAAAIFAVHPLRVESVVWIAERKEVLCALFWVLTLGAWHSYAVRPTPRRYALAALALAAALAAKPMAVTLPLVLLLADVWPLGRSGSGAARPPFLRRLPGPPLVALLVEKAPLLLLSAASSIVTIAAQARAGAIQSADPLSLGMRAANALVATAAYLGKLVWPADLAVYYPFPPAGHPAWKTVAAFAIVAAVSIAVALLRRHPFLAFGWIWYLVSLTPVIGLVRVGEQAMADRYTHLPQVGVVIALVWAAAAIAQRFSPPRGVPAAAAAAILAALVSLSLLQTAHWRTERALWTRAVEVTRENAVAHNNLAAALIGEGRDREAMEHLGEAVRINPRYPDALLNAGLVTYNQGDLDRALAWFRRALEVKPIAKGHFGLASIHAQRGQLHRAVEEYGKAIGLDPGYGPARTNLGNVYQRLGMTDQAIEQFEQAIRIDPRDWTAHNNLGTLYQSLGLPERAVAHFQRALDLAPEAELVRHNLGSLLMQAGRYREAVGQFQEALRLNPGYQPAREDLAKALAKLAP